MKYAIATLAFVMMAAAGCAQVHPPTPAQGVTITGNAPQIPAGSTWAGCSASDPCQVAIYRCSGGATACSSTSNSAWSEITTPTAGQSNSRPSLTAVSTATAQIPFSYADDASAGLTVYYNAQLVQDANYSVPSNIVGPLSPTNSIPGVTANGTVESALAPPLEKIGPIPATKNLAMGAISGLRIVQ